MKKCNLNLVQLSSEMGLIIWMLGAKFRDADSEEQYKSAMADVADLAECKFLAVMEGEGRGFVRYWSIFDNLCLLNRKYIPNLEWNGKFPLKVFRIAWESDSWSIEEL